MSWHAFKYIGVVLAENMTAYLPVVCSVQGWMNLRYLGLVSTSDGKKIEESSPLICLSPPFLIRAQMWESPILFEWYSFISRALGTVRESPASRWIDKFLKALLGPSWQLFDFGIPLESVREVFPLWSSVLSIEDLLCDFSGGSNARPISSCRKK